MYRVNNFKNIADKHYPYVPEDHDEWPHTDKPDGGRENHMRLNFEEKFDSDTNWPKMERWRDRVRQQGGIRVAGAQAYLEVISDDDLLERVKDRFKWECRTYKKAMGDAPIPTKNRTETGAIITPEPIVEPNPAPLTQEEIAAKSAELATMATATRQGFQQTVSRR
ncbi:hypothetical protein FRC12_008268 [Ceratobasidium sp. 428]|nr:hypothetical protein FRC12_008268 [Ceratobasidium sp. 428]